MRSICLVLVAVLTAVSLPRCAWAQSTPALENEPTAGQHADDHDHDHAQPEEPEEERMPKWPTALALPAIDGPKPWSEKPILDDPDRFHIAIMTDNTGGHRPGIWMQAVERLNLLRPQFVVSVGDLIEGYTSDRNEIEAQWAEFLGFIDKMEMKFFFVAGNHDLSNPVMHKVWREHFGKEWYSFDYRGVHFICLNSEDPEDHIGQEQLAWIKQDLADHADARWTLLFFHKPLWLISERAKTAGNPDPTQWSQVEEWLGSRPHTVFAGHVHHYVQYDRRGMKYYHLATTGGASPLRGVPYGEFDHVTWLTMEKNGPHIANVLLDGILPANAVTEAGIARFRSFLANTRLEIAPILVDQAEGFSQGRIELRLTNGFDQPVSMTGRLDGLPLKGLYVEPADLSLTAPPGATAELSVDIRFAEQIQFEHLSGTLLNARLRTDEEVPLTAERIVPVVIDRRYRLPAPPAALALDGDTQEWADMPLATPEVPLIFGPMQQWQGKGDASFQYSLASDDQNVYIACRVLDDAVTPEDAFEFWVDARPMDVRAADGGFSDKAFRFQFTPPDAAGKVTVRLAGPRELAPRAAIGKRTAAGYELEAAFPLAAMMADQGEAWQSFQATALLVDADDAKEEPIRLLWRGTADYEKRNTNWGQFVR